MARLTPDNVQRAKDLIALYPQSRSALIPILHVVQEQDGWLTPDGMAHAAELLGIAPAEVSDAGFHVREAASSRRAAIQATHGDGGQQRDVHMRVRGRALPCQHPLRDTLEANVPPPVATSRRCRHWTPDNRCGCGTSH